jgi:murein DD-endopeptidase MepM/ murein hydrolase activator NlpD
MAAALACGGSGIASAQSGGTADTGATGTSGSTGSSGSDGSLALKTEAARPGRIFAFGTRRATYHFEIGGAKRKNLKIEAVNRKSWRVVRRWRRDGVRPDTRQTIHWSGTNRKGRAVGSGMYLFRVRTRSGVIADRSRTKSDDRSFGVYPDKFPVRARHTYGDGYGAPRSGHLHQGQDVLAKCGSKLVAGRGGRVQYRAYQASGAGYYVVIDGRGTGQDFVYMHLQRRGRPKRGARVRTGERIGWVGHTGDATGCHLHFEMWSRPGWYEGGHAMRSVTHHLRAWDGWS